MQNLALGHLSSLKRSLITVIGIFLCTITVHPCAATNPSANKGKRIPSITITTPEHQAVVLSPVKLTLLAKNLMIMPAGVPHTESGHYHVYVVSGKTKKVVMLSKGERETSLTLAPGAYDIQAELVDHLARPFSPKIVTQTVGITVIPSPAINSQQTKH